MDYSGLTEQLEAGDTTTMETLMDATPYFENDHDGQEAMNQEATISEIPTVEENPAGAEPPKN